MTIPDGSASPPDALTRIAEACEEMLARLRREDAEREENRREQRASLRGVELQWCQTGDCPYCARVFPLLARGNTVFACAACLSDVMEASR